eukprot:jgi/Psemu1/195694/e_gw1.176.67.1
MAEVVTVTTNFTTIAAVEDAGVDADNNASEIPALTVLNWVNGAVFVLTILATFGTQGNNRFTRGWMMQDNGTLSAKYQSLVTPAGYAFSIWGLIFATEGLWTILQFGADWRSSWFVRDIVGYNFVWACLSQSVWSVVFACEQITASIVPMLATLVSLVPIAHRIFFRFWLMAFPMLLHTGWILAATLVNTNVVFVARGAPSQVQIVVGWISLSILVLSGLVILNFCWWFGTDSRNALVIPCVLAWASLAISRELDDPRESIATGFAPDIVSCTRLASRNGGLLILFVALVIAIVW